MDDAGCSLDLAISWSLSSKNSLPNVSSYSPNQLIFRQNLNIPFVLINKLLILERVISNAAVANYLNAMHAASFCIGRII